MKLSRFFIWFLLGFFVVFLIFLGSYSMSSKDAVKEISVTELYDKIDKGLVTEMDIMVPGGLVTGIYNLSEEDKTQRFITRVADYGELEKIAVAKGVKLKIIKEESSFLEVILPWLFLIGVFVFIFWWLGRKAPGNNVKLFPKAQRFDVEQRVCARFSDVAGCDEVIEEVKEVVDFLTNPNFFRNNAARVPRGLLLIGPSGTGKTLLARAIAGEAGVKFVAINGADFVELFVGVGAARVRELFASARKHAPCIIFIDEIDAVGRTRGSSGMVSHEEREQTLNALLAEMDGFEDRTNVLVIAATNRPEVLDRALVRKGRFDRQLVMPLPDVKGREAILKVHTRGKRLVPDVDLMAIARMTVGFSGADLENLVNEAGIFAIRSLTKDQQNKQKPDKVVILKKDFEDAFEKIALGPERKSTVLSQQEKELVAYHEAGHTLAIVLLGDGAEPLRKVTIVPRGQALGVTHQLPKEDRYLATKEELWNKLVVLMAGRVAEQLIFKTESTGAKGDFMEATQIARSMVCEYGMSEKIGKIVYNLNVNSWDSSENMDCSPTTRALIDEEVKLILDEAYKKAEILLEENKIKLDKIAKALVEKETLNAGEVSNLLKNE